MFICCYYIVASKMNTGEMCTAMLKNLHNIFTKQAGLEFLMDTHVSFYFEFTTPHLFHFTIYSKRRSSILSFPRRKSQNMKRLHDLSLLSHIQNHNKGTEILAAKKYIYLQGNIFWRISGIYSGTTFKS